MLGTIVFWILFGLVVGFIANALDPHSDTPGGLLGNIVVGILGSVVGGWIGNALNIQGSSDMGFNLWSIVLSVIGALLVLFIYRLVRRGTNT